MCARAPSFDVTCRPAQAADAAPAAPGPLLVAGYEDGWVGVWDLRAPAAPLGGLRLHEEPAMALALHPSGEGERGGGGGLGSCGAVHLVIWGGGAQAARPGVAWRGVHTFPSIAACMRRGCAACMRTSAEQAVPCRRAV